MIAKIGSFLKDDIDPCIESIQLKTKCYSIFQLHIKLLFNCSKTIFCHCGNIGRPKSCDMIIAVE